YFAQGKIGFPIRPGHEWCGVVSALGEDVDTGWLGARVTGDTMLGCGRCSRCAAGRGHVCADRREVGIVHWPGALAEKVLVRASSLYRLPMRSTTGPVPWSGRAATGGAAAPPPTPGAGTAGRVAGRVGTGTWRAGRAGRLLVGASSRYRLPMRSTTGPVPWSSRAATAGAPPPPPTPGRGSGSWSAGQAPSGC